MRIVVRGTFVGSDGEHDFVDENFAPYEVRKQLASDTGGVREGCKLLVNQVESIWARMEERFRRAVEQGHCRIFARRDKAHASKFTQITGNAFELFEVVDWKKGIAKRGDQDWLFALYAAPPLPQSTVAPGLSASATSIPEPSLEPLEQGQIDTSSKKAAREIVARVEHAAIEPKVFTIKEAVAYSKIGRSVLYKRIEQEEIIAQNVGKKSRYGYLIDEERGGYMGKGVLKYDLIHEKEAGYFDYGEFFGGEALFVAKAGAADEDDGYLLDLLMSDTEAEMLILDAKSMKELARLHLPQRVPFGVHACWLDEQMLSELVV
jgi:hypothetical protein